MTQNYYDIIIERIIKILKAEFKTFIKIFKEDRVDIHQNQICLLEGISTNEHTWAPQIVVDRFPVTIILRHIWQADEDRKERFNLDFHKIKCSLLDYRSDATTKWFNGIVTEASETEIERDEENKPLFWKRVLSFSCVMAYNFTE